MTNWLSTHWSFISQAVDYIHSFVPTHTTTISLEITSPEFPYTTFHLSECLHLNPRKVGLISSKWCRQRVRSKPSLKGCQDAGSAKHGVNTCQLSEPLTPASHKSPLELAAPLRIMLQSQTVLIKAQVISLIKQQGHYQDFKSVTSTKLLSTSLASQGVVYESWKNVHIKRHHEGRLLDNIKDKYKMVVSALLRQTNKVIKNTTSTKTWDSLKG